MKTQTEPTGREQELAEVILGYLEAAEAGQTPDRRGLIDHHPELAQDLEDFFAGRDAVERVAGPLRGFVGSGLASAVEEVRRRARPEGPASLGLPPAGPGAPLGELGDFRLLREIGRGGMGIVYEAHQISLNRRVALKVLPLAAALDPKHLQRFRNEAQAAAQLHHTNIVPVYGVGCERGVHYYAMQLIEGQSLAAVVAELQHLAGTGAAAHPGLASALLEGVASPPPPAPAGVGEPTAVYAGAPGTGEAPAIMPTPDTGKVAANVSTERSIKSQRFFRRAAHVGLKAAEALEHAHEAGVVHRDIKPANLLLDLRGNVWVTDFGLAMFKDESGLTMTGELLGTLRYMSPEQTFAKRGLVDRRADVYSLGATLYELVTLVAVFAGHDRQELLHQIAYEEPVPPRRINKAVPVELETILLKALAKNPDERYASAQDMAEDLQRFLQDKPVLAQRPTLTERARKWARRHRPVVYSAAALLVMAVVGLSVGMLVIYQERALALAARDQAQVQRDLAMKSSEQAREAVDFFTQVAQEDLNLPALEPVRRRLLQRALTYYRAFVEQHDEDPALQARLIAGQKNIAGILEDLGDQPEAVAVCDQAKRMAERVVRLHPGDREARLSLLGIQDKLCKLQGVWELTLLKEPIIRDELGMTQDQVKAMEDLAREFSRGPCPMMAAVVRMDPKERHGKYLELVASNGRAIVKALKADQARRLRQIALQRRGPDAFLDPEVVRTLDLTPQQQHQIASLRARECAATAGLACDGCADKQRRVARVKAVEMILGVLAPEQRARWGQLVGSMLPG